MRTTCKIIKTFPYSFDGFTTKEATAGTVIDIPSDLVLGLRAAGYIGDPDNDGTGEGAENKDDGPPTENKGEGNSVPSGSKPAGGSSSSGTAETREQQRAVVIPENWRDLDWQEQRSLASKVSSSPIKKKEEAAAAIEAEIELRKTEADQSAAANA